MVAPAIWSPFLMLSPITPTPRSCVVRSVQVASLCGIAVLLGVTLARPAAAQQIDTRQELNAIGGPNLSTEDFEAFDVAPDSEYNLRYVGGPPLPPPLDAATFVDGQTNLVLPGLDFVDAFINGDTSQQIAWRGLQWNGAGYYGDPSRDLIANDGQMQIYFDSPTILVGMDLGSYLGYTESTNAAVFDASGNLLFSTTIGLPPTAQPQFFGYYSGTDPIGEVVLTGDLDSVFWGPTVDNVSFSGKIVAPEPGAGGLVFIGCGLMATVRSRRRRTRRLAFAAR
jgi:hypothetical protein